MSRLSSSKLTRTLICEKTGLCKINDTVGFTDCYIKQLLFAAFIANLFSLTDCSGNLDVLKPLSVNSLHSKVAERDPCNFLEEIPSEVVDCHGSRAAFHRLLLYIEGVLSSKELNLLSSISAFYSRLWTPVVQRFLRKVFIFLTLRCWRVILPIYRKKPLNRKMTLMIFLKL